MRDFQCRIGVVSVARHTYARNTPVTMAALPNICTWRDLRSWEWSALTLARNSALV